MPSRPRLPNNEAYACDVSVPCGGGISSAYGYGKVGVLRYCGNGSACDKRFYELEQDLVLRWKG